MTATKILLVSIPRCQRIISQIGAWLVLGAVSAASLVFYLYTCLSLARLQQLSPDQLARAVLGA
jgi:hypothetical protein